MSPLDWLQKEHILVGAKACDKWALLDQMVCAIYATAPFQKGFISLDALRQAVVKHEREKPSGILAGFACANARVPGLEETLFCLAVLEEPIYFGAVDGVPAQFVCLVLVPEDMAGEALKIMALFRGLLSRPAERTFLSSATDPAEVAAYLRERFSGHTESVRARNLMREPLASIYPDTPLPDIAQVLMQYNLDSISVIERDGTLVGEVTCEQIFQLGMPEFFRHLKSVTFIREFDPFENYFRLERQTVARDIMTQNYAALPEDATILEVVFELAVHHHAKVYVVRDGKRVGIIDRALVLNRVINL